MSYAEDLKSVEWQKKRLSVLTRDNWTCQLCKDTETQLHIHHKFYQRDRKCFEYDDEDLITYCKHCHALVEYAKDHFKDVQEILHVFKHSIQGEYRIYVIVRDIQNLLHCAIFNYDNKENDLYYDLYIPEHIISRIKFEFQAIKNKENNA